MTIHCKDFYGISLKLTSQTLHFFFFFTHFFSPTSPMLRTGRKKNPTGTPGVWFPEWKADYIPQCAESVPEQLTLCDPSSPPGSDPLDFVQQGPTLRSERGPTLSPADVQSTSTVGKAAPPQKLASVSTVDQAGQQRLTGKHRPPEATREKRREDGNPSTLTPSHGSVPAQAATVEGGGAGEEEDGKRRVAVGEGPDTLSAAAQRDGAAPELRADVLGASKSSTVRNLLGESVLTVKLALSCIDRKIIGF